MALQSRAVRASLLTTAVLFACVTGAARLAAQPAAPSPNSEPDAVRLDAIVTDANGRGILDLRPSDFQLLENGTARPIQSVVLRTLPTQPDPVEAIESEAEEKRAARTPGTRTFAFFLDDFHVTAGPSADRARAALDEFIDQTLRPADLAIVMRPLDPVLSIRFTRDRAQLHGAVRDFAGRKGDYTPRSPFEEQYIGRAPAAVAAARRQIVTAGLRELTMRLGDIEADRGVIVFVSEGFSREPIPGSRQLRMPDLQGLIRAASRFHVPVYTINPALPEEDLAAADDRPRSTSMLQWLAAQTGGRSVDAAGLVAGMARLKHDLETYYTLTYRPAQNDGRFHTIEVRTTRRNLAVHTAAGYWSPLGTLRAMLAASTVAPISRRALKRSNLIDAWVGLLRDPDGTMRMVVTWEPRSRGIAAPQVVALKARMSEGAALFDGRLERVGSTAALPSDSARFSVPPGRVEIDMTIYDAEGKVLDTDVRDMDVPDVGRAKSGPILLAPEVVRARTFRDFQSAASDPDAAPASVRTFARGDRLLIRASAFDASGVPVQVTAKVLNEWGQPMRTIDPLQATPRDGTPQFALPLTWLVPGEYQIELLAANANGAVKQRVVFKVSG